MASLKYIKVILAGSVSVILISLAFFAWNESFYFDAVPCLSPIQYDSGGLAIRNDTRGDGDFGTKRNGNRNHEGIDLFAPVGTPVRAAKGGIAFAGDYPKGMGLFVKIKHKNGMLTVYGHLSKIYIKPIQRVRQGQIIGEVGKTGNARYREILPHLHFEIRRYGVPLDPKQYIRK